MRIALYCRVSDDKLKEDGERRQDVQRQVEHLKPQVEAYMKYNPDCVYVGEFIDDGKSAFKEDYQSRPAFCRLLSEMKAHRVNRVYVESLDRWARRVVDGLTTLKEVTQAGGTVVSLAEGEADITLPQGWFKCGIAFLMSEWASREKSWRVTQALDRRRLDARHTCGSCGVVHMGRHPNTCKCTKCLKSYPERRVGSEMVEKSDDLEKTTLG